MSKASDKAQTRFANYFETLSLGQDETDPDSDESSSFGITEWNPPISPAIITVEDRNFKLISDSDLLGGTKQRAAVPYIAKRKTSAMFAYAGAPTGYAQVALAYACRLSGKKAAIFIPRSNVMTPLSSLAAALGGKMQRVSPGYLKRLQYQATEYVKAKRESISIELLPFGLHSDEFINMLAGYIRAALPKELAVPARLWLVAGSGTLLKALHQIWPDTTFLVVQVGKSIPEAILEGIHHVLYEAPESFYALAELPPPYSSVRKYDAKVWRFVLANGQNGDWIWNVGKDVDEAILASVSNEFPT